MTQTRTELAPLPELDETYPGFIEVVRTADEARFELVGPRTLPALAFLIRCDLERHYRDGPGPWSRRLPGLGREAVSAGASWAQLKALDDLVLAEVTAARTEAPGTGAGAPARG